MKRIKTIIDREPVSSDYIASRQNFGKAIHQVTQMNVPVWKSGWFYGPVGMAVVAITVSIATIDPASAESTASSSVNHAPSTPEVATHAILNDSRQENTLETPVPTSERTPVNQVNAVSTVVSISGESPVTDPPTLSEVPERVTDPLPIVDKNAGKTNTLPHIANFYTGEIPVSQLNSPLECNDDIKIIAFNVHFNTFAGTETASIIGNKIPGKVIEAIKAHNIGYMLFFTDIKGRTSDGKVVSLMPMNFVATYSK